MPYNTDNAIERLREMVAAKTTWVHQGRSIHGADCVGALVYAFQYDGEVPAYPRDPVNGELERELRRVFGEPILYRDNLLDSVVDRAALRAGDIVSCQYAGPVRHVAVVADHPALVGQLSLIHTSATVGFVVEHILDAKWMRRIVGVWRP